MDRHLRALRSLTLLFAVILCLLVQALPAAGVVLTVTAGYEGYVVPGRWVPLAIEVSGAMDGWVQITRLHQGLPVVTEEYRCRVEDEPRRLLIPVFAEETGSRLEVRLVEDGKVLGRVEVDLLEKVFPGHLILMADLPEWHQQARRGQAVGPVLFSTYGQEPVLIIPVEFSALPGTALTYDGVSALVVNGDLAALNPLQTQALLSWLAGGGSLLHLSTAGEIPGEEGWEVRRYGRGRIIRPRAEAGNNGQPVTTIDWQRLLALEPYPRPLRLTPGVVFREGEVPWFFEEKTGNTLSPLAVVLALWFLGGLAVAVLFDRKRTAVALLCYLAATTLLAAPAGKWVAGRWQRGAVVYMRAVLLPEDAGVLIDTVIEFPESTWKTPVSPWGVTLALGEMAAGAINRAGTGETFWRHESLQPLMVVKQGDAKRLHLTGVLPPGTGPAGDTPGRTRGKTGPDRAVGLEKRRWTAGEEAAVQTPAGLLSREPWLAVLQTLFSEERWTFGYSDFPGFALWLENGRSNPVLWAEPASSPGGLAEE
ncbi:MAG: hypothetical protein GX085_06935 [Firmicutes bacterium]|nr:hypothetical protein [Bacillota bacterium]